MQGITIFKKYVEDVSCEFDEFRVNTHLCKMRFVWAAVKAPPRSCTYARCFLDLHENSIATYVWRLPIYAQVRTKRRLPCPNQPDPRPDADPNQTLKGVRDLSALEVGRGSFEFTSKSEDLSPTYVQLFAWWLENMSLNI